MKTETNNILTDKELEKMIENGELSTMTECAYGEAIAGMETKNNLNKENA
jgi:hypothetical protein